MVQCAKALVHPHISKNPQLYSRFAQEYVVKVVTSAKAITLSWRPMLIMWIWAAIQHVGRNCRPLLFLSKQMEHVQGRSTPLYHHKQDVRRWLRRGNRCALGDQPPHLERGVPGARLADSIQEMDNSPSGHGEAQSIVTLMAMISRGKERIFIARFSCSTTRICRWLLLCS
jgi:hypothetical protein